VVENEKLPDDIERGDSSAVQEDENELVFGLSDSFVREVVAALRDYDHERVLSELSGLNASDTAELISKIPDEDRKILLRDFSEKLDPYVFSELSWELRKVTLPELPAWQVAAIVSDLDSDDALDIIQSLDDETFKQAIIRQLSAKTRLTLQEGLSFPEDSAGRLMQREFVAVPQFWTVGKTIDYLRAAAEELPDDFFDIFVIDPTYHVTGEIPLNRLVRAKRSEKLSDIKLEDIHPIPALMDQEEVAQMFRRENLMSAPVVDEEGRLIGVITVDDVVDVIDEEAQEDLLKLGGVGNIDTYKAVMSTSLSRSKWLFINMFTAFLAAGVVSLFGATIEKVVALAALMPIVAGMGGNAGTQSLAISVRAIAMREVSSANYKRLIVKESLVGLTNGVMLSVVIGVLVGLLFGNVMLGAVIAMALVVNLAAAGLFGAAVPLLLNKFGQDPAISSAIFVTTMTDVLGFFAFLGLATILLI